MSDTETLLIRKHYCDEKITRKTFLDYSAKFPESLKRLEGSRGETTAGLFCPGLRLTGSLSLLCSLSFSESIIQKRVRRAQ